MRPVATQENIVVTLMHAVATEMGQYILPYCIQHYKNLKARTALGDCYTFLKKKSFKTKQKVKRLD